MASGRDAQLAARVRELAADIAASLDADILDVEVRGQGPHRVLRVVADTLDLDPDAALDVDAIALLSRRIEDALDAADAVPGSYTLEVTSPGADRPLRTERDFARNVGRDVRAQLVDGGELRGTVTGIADGGVVLDIDGDERRIELADVDHGRVVLPW